jgi:hypothetical protein
MSDLGSLRIWDDPGVRSVLSWYLDVAENRRPAKMYETALRALDELPGLIARAEAPRPAKRL